MSTHATLKVEAPAVENPQASTPLAEARLARVRYFSDASDFSGSATIEHTHRSHGRNTLRHMNSPDSQDRTQEPSCGKIIRTSGSNALPRSRSSYAAGASSIGFGMLSPTGLPPRRTAAPPCPGRRLRDFQYVLSLGARPAHVGPRPGSPIRSR